MKNFSTRSAYVTQLQTSSVIVGRWETVKHRPAWVRRLRERQAALRDRQSFAAQMSELSKVTFRSGIREFYRQLYETTPLILRLLAERAAGQEPFEVKYSRTPYPPLGSGTLTPGTDLKARAPGLLGLGKDSRPA